MADPPPYLDSNNDPDEDTGSTPRWVKAFGIIVIVLVLLVVIVMFIGGGNHGPSRHTPSGGGHGESTVTAGNEGMLMLAWVDMKDSLIIVISDQTAPEGGH
jgi:hypothetical protein